LDVVVSGELSSRGRLQGFVCPGLVIDLGAKDRYLLLRGVTYPAGLVVIVAAVVITLPRTRHVRSSTSSP
jgi:hypothetical protein